MPWADADESTARFSTGLPSSVDRHVLGRERGRPAAPERQDVRAVREERGPGLDDLEAGCLVGRRARESRRPRRARRASARVIQRERGSSAEIRDVRRDGPVREQAGGQLDAALLELVRGRPAAARSAGARPLIVPSGANESILNSKMSCSVITSDSIRCTSVIAVHAARAVLEPLDVDDQVERRGDLLADRPHRQVVAGHQHHRLDAGERVARRVGVDRRQRAVVARVHRLEHVERLGAAALADDDPVGAHAQRVPHEVADRDRALALDVRRAGLEPEHVPLVELELGGVLDRDDPLVVRDRRTRARSGASSCRSRYRRR